MAPAHQNSSHFPLLSKPPASSLVLPLLLLLASIGPASGQAPAPARRVAYGTVPDVGLFIAGGLTGASPSRQVAFLDLAKEWDASNPSWTTLPLLSANLVHAAQQGVIVNGQLEFMVISGGVLASKLSTSTKTWSEMIQMPPRYYAKTYGLSAIADPVSGKVFVPSAYETAGVEPADTVVYDVFTNLATGAAGVDAAVGTPKDLYSYALAWSTERSSALLYGGKSASVGLDNTALLEFSASGHTWTVVKTSGTAPGQLISACMVSANNGQQMVLFGGFTGAGAEPSVPSGSIYILDVKTLTWTKGQDVAPALRRGEHACTTAGDYFVAWGGGPNPTTTVSSSAPIIYNLKTGQWTEKFVPAAPQDRENPSAGGSGSGSGAGSSSSSSNLGAIIGGVVGALVVVLVAGFLLFRRRKAKRAARDSATIHLQSPATFRDDTPPPQLLHGHAYSPAPQAFTPTTGHGGYSDQIKVEPSMDRMSSYTSQYSESTQAPPMIPAASKPAYGGSPLNAVHTDNLRHPQQMVPVTSSPPGPTFQHGPQQYPSQPGQGYHSPQPTFAPYSPLHPQHQHQQQQQYQQGYYPPPTTMPMHSTASSTGSASPYMAFAPHMQSPVTAASSTTTTTSVAGPQYILPPSLPPPSSVSFMNRSTPTPDRTPPGVMTEAELDEHVRKEQEELKKLELEQEIQLRKEAIGQLLAQKQNRFSSATGR